MRIFKYLYVIISVMMARKISYKVLLTPESLIITLVEGFQCQITGNLRSTILTQIM